MFKREKSMDTGTLTIVIPAYNEAENLRLLVDDWYPIIEKYGNEKSSILIVNDGSKDNSEEILRELCLERKQLKYVTKQNGGHGSAVLYGYRLAIDSDTDWVFQTDSDRQTNPKEFEKFWNLRNTYDVIIGNRIVRGDGKARKMVEKVVCILLKLIFGIKVKDANAPFRLMKAEVLGKYLDRMPLNYNLPNIMITTFFVYYGENVSFEEISFKSRSAGKNSINFNKIFKIGLNALRDFRSFKKSM